MTCNLCDTCAIQTATGKDIFFEIHVTVEHNRNFAEDCYELGVKPIVIDMGKGIPTHSMTSTSLKNVSDSAALSQANLIASALTDRGHKVQRVKVETVPWHPAAEHLTDKQYFETHFALIPPIDEQWLSEFCKYYDLHRSRNLLKKDDGSVQMLTYRTRRGGRDVHLRHVSWLEAHIRRNGVKLKKTITEFVFYDTNESMDDQWLKKKK